MHTVEKHFVTTADYGCSRQLVNSVGANVAGRQSLGNAHQAGKYMTEISVCASFSSRALRDPIMLDS